MVAVDLLGTVQSSILLKQLLSYSFITMSTTDNTRQNLIHQASDQISLKGNLGA